MPSDQLSPMTHRVNRDFVRLAAGQVHYRFTGGAAAAGHLPVYMAHSSPGSSMGLVGLIEALAPSRPVVAPDLLGNGDSEPHAISEPAIADYADDAVALLDMLGIDQVDFYGQHTGALIGCELALRHPSRVRRLVLDGFALFPPDLVHELQQRYAPAVLPDSFGGHLAWAWHFVRELSLHFPHYAQDPEHRLHVNTVPSPSVLNRQVVDVLKSLETYHLAYRAAFAFPSEKKLGLVRHPTMLMAAHGDPLDRYLEQASAILGQGAPKRVSRLRRAEAISEFLDQP